MRAKKHLKGRSGAVYFNDDLTAHNKKMLYILKQSDAVESAYSLDCSVWGVTKAAAGRPSQRIKIRSPDDLFKIGCTQEEMAQLYLKWE